MLNRNALLLVLFRASFCLCAVVSIIHGGTASYKIAIELKLDDKRQPSKLEGREILTWTNDSPDTISDLHFHLYLNAFKNSESTFFKESGGQLRGDHFTEGAWGSIDILEMIIEGGEDLTKKIEFIQPDDGNKADQTVIRVPLTVPLKPGETVRINIKFKSQLPQVFARTGFFKQFALVGQWFPKIGVWEKVGDRGRTAAGWNCHQFHANSEFYADFGDYDVTMTVPDIFKGKIGATGKVQYERVHNDKTVSYNFVQKNVHDFAWTIDSDYVVVSRIFKTSEQVKQSEIDYWATRLKLPPSQIQLKDVTVTLLMQPEHASQTDRHFKAAFNAIKYFGLMYGKYPYDTLTIVDPPHNGSGAAGMEYPTFITAGTEWKLSVDQNPEGVIVHEFGHQYWQGMIASNEFEESWLDEGFNTYSTEQVMKVAYGPESIVIRLGGFPLIHLPFQVDHPFGNRILALRRENLDSILTPSWKFYDDLNYGVNSYLRTGLVMSTLEGYLGGEVMAQVMREYFTKWQYRHPSSQDFFDTVKSVTGQDLSWFFNQYVKGTDVLDYEIAEAESELLDSPLGLFDTEGKRIEQKGGGTSNGNFQTKVMVRRNGGAYYPMYLIMKFENGSEITGRPSVLPSGDIEYVFFDSSSKRTWKQNWLINERWMKIEVTTPSKIKVAQVDPYNQVLLDACITNNGIVPAESGNAPAFRWSTEMLFWLQSIFTFA